MVEDLLPKIRNSPLLLSQRDIHVLEEREGKWRPVDPEDVDWASVDTDEFPYRFVQDPGPQNALGRIKMIIPNGMAIYLHDTPEKALYERSVRALSSGCVRVERAFDLAAWAIGSSEWTTEALEAAAEGETTTRIPVADPPQVHLVYHTAFVDGGRVRFVADVYRANAAIARALEKLDGKPLERVRVPAAPLVVSEERSDQRSRATRSNSGAGK